MTRRRKMYAAALSVLILTTASASALLCRGRAPSRFATPNLPAWERTPPHPAPPRVALRGFPLLPVDDASTTARLTQTDIDALFVAIEHPARKHPSPPDAGRPGLWLVAACAVARPSPALRRQRDAVAVRLLEAQCSDGSLAAENRPGRWNREQAEAHGQNLRGLLAYYAVSHEPAPIYAAMLAGDLVVTQRPTADTAGSLVLPLTLLYQATGETSYRRWAEGRAEAGGADGPGLCALYAATGRARYLQEAQRVWGQERACRYTDPDLTASLWVLTGSHQYRAALRTLTAFGPCPLLPGRPENARSLDALHVSTAWHGASGAAPITQHKESAPHAGG